MLQCQNPVVDGEEVGDVRQLTRATTNQAWYNINATHQGDKMTATNEELKAMYLNESTKELEDQLASCEATIQAMLSYRRSWALDSRQMRIAESNSSYLRAELRRRETGSCEIQHSQVGEAVYRDVK